MGTSLTLEFWRLFAVLLGISTAVTFALSAALDALVLRAQRRRIRHRPALVRATSSPRRPDRAPVHH
ncbi:hypothetical protein PV733_38520 [Streptomyces europaeiscabiei]|uniref:hypothetical protein n=1 Tax=Streptomyces europaeiscabiei TaxID=146819 RepID=UPI0029B90EBF|nr:hypothetical protein [Streptomyces europaeiscabiei]MDX3714725.1 hypothetical protein [Streptomyces europaeiscabiei]